MYGIPLCMCSLFLWFLTPLTCFRLLTGDIRTHVHVHFRYGLRKKDPLIIVGNPPWNYMSSKNKRYNNESKLDGRDVETDAAHKSTVSDWVSQSLYHFQTPSTEMGSVHQFALQTKQVW